MIRIQEFGLYDKLYKKWNTKTDVMCKTSVVLLPLGLAETYPVFAILVISLIASIVVNLLENLYVRFITKRT